MWSQSKFKREILVQKSTPMRFVPKSKWTLPMKTSNYWRKILEDIETPTIKVRGSSLTSFPSFISDPFLKRSISNVSKNYNTSKIKITTNEPVVKISPPSPIHNRREYLNTSTENRSAPSVKRVNNSTSGDNSYSQHDIQCHSFESETQKELPNEIKNTPTPEDMNSNHVYPSLFKIAQLSRISKCINDFLAHTKDKVKSGKESEVFKNSVSPEQTLNTDTKKSEKVFVAENMFNKADSRWQSEETLEIIDTDRGEEIEENITARSEQKKVCFLNVEDDEYDLISEAEHQPTPRRRAPSIAIASALPSFGKNVSSLESSDSLNSCSFNEDFAFQMNTSQEAKDYENIESKNFQKSDGSQKGTRNLLQVPDFQKVGNAANLPLKQRKVQLEYLIKSSRQSEMKSVKKIHHWPKKSIVHVLRALKVMKSSNHKTIKDKKNDHLFLTSLPLQSSSVFEGSFGSTITHEFTDYPLSIQSDCYEEESTSTSLTSSCSYSSVRRRPIEKPSICSDKKNLSFPGLVDELKIKSDTLSRRISDEIDISVVSSENEEKSSSIIKKNKSVVALENIPQIDKMYQRKKGDKCLACLHTSMKKNSIHILKINDVQFSIPSMSEEEFIIDEINDIFSGKSDYNSRYKLFQRQSMINLEQSDIESELLEDNRITGKIRSTSELNYASSNLPDQYRSNMSSSSYGVERRSDVGHDRKSIISSKSLKSNLSLLSDRSKTVSDQDDSDQAVDEGGGMEENIVESRSKFLAPCHAPLNLRPSLEPLKALRNKKARSIQSRMASLEKSTEAESDEKSEDDEIPIVVAKGKDNNEKKYISYKTETDRSTIFVSESEDEQRQNSNCVMSEGSLLKLDDLTNLLDQIKHKSELREQCKANELLIADKIFSELNMTENKMEYGSIDSFRSVSPILSDRDIIETSQKLLKERKSIPEILQELAKMHSKRLSKRAFYKRNKLNPDITKNDQIFNRLLMLLADSKFYLHYQNNVTNPTSSPQQKPSINSRQLRRVLPVKSYNLIAPILGLPEWRPKRWTSVRDANKLRATSKKSVTSEDQSNIKLSDQGTDTAIDLIAHPPTQKERASTEDEHESRTKKQLNPYGLFITKPRRKVVIWRPLTERDLEGYDPEATLKRRAAKITDEICADFCQWLRGLGGFDTTIDEEVLKEMFETDFSADACKAMQVILKELPMVPTAIAKARGYPKAAELERTKEQLMFDLKAENQKTRLTAFGLALPKDLKLIPPKNEVISNWLQCKNVPEDLETMDVVWKNITDLDSVKGFLNWTQTHSKIELPAALAHSSTAKTRNKKQIKKK